LDKKKLNKNKCKVSNGYSSSYKWKFKQSKVLISNGWVDLFESLWKLVLVERLSLNWLSKKYK
jgi:hypothetical protein